MTRPLLGLLLVVAVLTGCATTAPEDAEPVLAGPTTIDVDGVSRSFTVRAPVETEEPLPLLIVLHGASGNSTSIERDTGLSDRGDGLIIVYPNGTPRYGDDSQSTLAWNSGHCCGRPSDDNVDDVTFITELIAELEASYSVDPTRIYIAGFSNGGMMAYRLACELDGLLAGIAAVAGSFNADDCESPAPLKVIIFHGTADSTLPYEGSDNLITKTSVPDTAAFWAQADGCTVDPVAHTEGQLSFESYSACDNGAEVQLVTIDGGAHVWPRAGDGDASALIVDFFELG